MQDAIIQHRREPATAAAGLACLQAQGRADQKCQGRGDDHGDGHGHGDHGFDDTQRDNGEDGCQAADGQPGETEADPLAKGGEIADEAQHDCAPAHLACAFRPDHGNMAKQDEPDGMNVTLAKLLGVDLAAPAQPSRGEDT